LQRCWRRKRARGKWEGAKALFLSLGLTLLGGSRGYKIRRDQMKSVTRKTYLSRETKITYEIQVPETHKEWIKHIGKLSAQNILEWGYYVKASAYIKTLTTTKGIPVNEAIQIMKEWRG
jgi:hypothetical protein